jgi:FeS assembly SUF system protein
MSLLDEVIRALRTVRDPEMPVSVYDLGLIYDIALADNGAVSLLMTLTAPNCPVAGSLPADVQKAVRQVPGVTDVRVELTFDPPWSKDLMTPAAKLFLGMEDSSGPLINIRL